MSGYLITFGTCISCGAFFGFNPERVPSIRVNAAGQPDPGGRREPVCRACWDRRQAYRSKHGMPEEYLLPGAYEPSQSSRSSASSSRNLEQSLARRLAKARWRFSSMPTYVIQRVFGGAFRRAVQHYIATNHYMRSSGGSGQLFTVMADDQIAGACLIGATSSENQTRSLVRGACLIGPVGSQDAERSIATGVLVRQIKRLVVADDVPSDVLPESKLLRHAMRAVADEYGVPVLFVAYADQAAKDLRTGHPLAGWVYLASGFFHAGETTSRRTVCIDHHGAARNTRQGDVTLSGRNLPWAGEVFHGEYVTKDWRMAKLPPARIWLAVVTPSRYTQRQARHAWRAAWASLDPRRRLAARQWISHVAWRRALAAGVVAIGEPRPHHLRRFDRFQPAWWRGHDITRTAAPVWVPLLYQQHMLHLDDVLGETTASRAYAPLIYGEGIRNEAQEGVQASPRRVRTVLK